MTEEKAPRSGVLSVNETQAAEQGEQPASSAGCDRCDGFGSAKTYESQACLPLNGRVQGIDWCIHQIVAALNAGGVRTVACCCGHGRIPGRIDLEDGRVLTITRPAPPSAPDSLDGESAEDSRATQPPAAAQPDAWRPIETYDNEWPIRIRAPELVDLDFNEAGETDACALCDPEWYAAKWNNSQDFFETVRVHPTHWQPITPATGAESALGDELGSGHFEEGAPGGDKVQIGPLDV